MCAIEVFVWKRVFQLISWARCDLYYIFTVIDSYQQKKKKKKTNTGVGGNGSHSSGSGTGFSSSFFVGLGREEIKICDAFWKQEMSPWSNAPLGLRNPFSKKTYF